MRTNLTSHYRTTGLGTVEARNRRRWQMRPTLLVLEDRKLLSAIVVNNPTDMPVIGRTDLRQAIVEANTNGGDQTITFDETVFQLPQTITLDPALGQLELSDTTGIETITGPGAGLLSISGNNASRVFSINYASAALSGLTITGGSATTGGGLCNQSGTVSLTNCTVSGNSATNGGGVFTGGVYNYYSGGTYSRHDHPDQLHRQRQLRLHRRRPRSAPTTARPRWPTPPSAATPPAITAAACSPWDTTARLRWPTAPSAETPPATTAAAWRTVRVRSRPPARPR